MTKITPSMRLKVKRDTFFFPDSNNGVYFRNNLCSFRMEGSTIDQWVEKLMPMFNGEYTIGDLTGGLPNQYQNRVNEIAEVLYKNGFVQDISNDRSHQLSDQILKKYASQIEFLNNFGDSGAYRFQTYRQTKVLAVGSGPFLVSLVSALIESGLPKFHFLIKDSNQTNRRRMMEIVSHARLTDSEVAIEEVFLQKEGKDSWREIVQGYDSIMYVSQDDDIEELRSLHAICREEGKMFIPAISLQQVGLAGPLVNPESKGCWESAWRRIHQSALSKDEEFTAYSSTAGAMLANVIVFELFKEITREEKSEQEYQFFLLDLDTLEGNWHSFIPHPMVDGNVSAEWVQDLDLQIENSKRKSEESVLFLILSHLTSAESGIFHIWEEGDLSQLPLAQCRVQAVDLLSEGPAELLPEIISAGLTHEEARRESGLAGLEAYVSRIANLLDTTQSPQQEVNGSFSDEKEYVGVGAGETIAECVARGLQRCLEEELNKQLFDQKYLISRVLLSEIGDERCRYYLQALTTLQGEPVIGLGEEVDGFPVVWIGTNDDWHRNTGLNITLALRNALQQALMDAQNKVNSNTMQQVEASSILLEEKAPQNIIIPACEDIAQPEVLKYALQTLEQNHKRLSVIELAVEPFLQEGLARVYGVLLRKEESS
ncbi:putative thiazole-containing bacteriocin maturation protein [Cytobacillus dafuensis]|uniref:Putative thiazole-containing bacteriocin maturation protein n=1 Tax=Cytobacillus dafuensis TaxID=1742359 RepID=A0A5B8Z4Y4_CYTDA|nr:putative thiazole-containing bacteriocin maturation protein [Cytobacillus dafuensis]QED48160.1 putative thiazole-containing bacteriocin maturation protein [Cytobacillus dafuensis]